MKLINLFFIAGICIMNATNSYSQSTLLSLNAKNNTLEEVLGMIEKNSEYVFFYSDKAVNLKQKVSIRIKDQTIDKILDQLLAQTGNAYSIDDRQVFIGVKRELSMPIIAQQERINVTGIVKDKTGEPVIGATVIEKGNPSHGTITDLNGSFALQNIPKDAILQFSYVGMEPQEIDLKGRAIIHVVMESGTKLLDEVVVVGYGTQSRATLTTSISKVDNKALEGIPYTNLVSALQGTVSGVRVQTTTGQPGKAPRIIVRGGTSINSPDGAEPLYIVDGVIRNDIDDINSDDIESMQVLKDAASTAIYGARGSNGVVLITTKTGKTGRASVTYKYDLTLSRVGEKYDMASARDYIYYGRIGAQVAAARYSSSYLNKLYTASGFGTGNDLTENTAYTTQYLTPENQHKLNEGWESMPDPIDPSKTIIFKDTDWQDVLFRTGVSHNHNVNITGGTDKATFNASAGYMTNEGVAITTKYDRLSINMNGEVAVRDNLKFSARTAYSRSTDNGINEANIFSRAVGLVPTAKYTFEDGTLAPGNGRGSGNTAYYLKRNTNKNCDENITLIFGGNWEILPGLTFDPQFSIWKESYDNYSFTPSYMDGVNRWNTTRAASASYSKWWQTQVDATLAYKKEFKDHHLDIMAGYSYYYKSSYGMSASGEGALTDLIPTLNAVSKYTYMQSNISKQLMLGYFGRLNYNYKHRYLLSLNARYDAASQLGKSHKWGFFPGASIGWNIHEEDFWKDLHAESIRLKLRASYGVNGNITGMGPYTAQGEYSVGDKYLGVNAIQNTILPNHDLKWEESKTFDLGVDLALFDQRIDILFDYFNRNTDNLITQLPMPLSSGFGVITTNYGSLNNKGIELEVKAQLMPKNSELQWEFGFNTSKVKTKIRKLPDNGVERNRVGGYYAWDPSMNDYNWVGGLQEGGRIGDLFAWKQVGIYATDEEAKNDPVVDMMSPYEDKTKFGGDTKYLDSDNNGIIDEKDICYMGNTYPKWTGGISSSLSYKNFDLYLRMDYMTGHTIFNEVKIFLSGQWAGDLNFPQEMIDKGWKEQGDIATRPIYIPDDNSNLWRGGDWYGEGITNSEFYESGNFLCVRELTLSYKLPLVGLMDKIFNNVKLKVTGNNLHYFTKYTGTNPEFGGKDAGRYPLSKNFIFGVTATF